MFATHLNNALMDQMNNFAVRDLNSMTSNFQLYILFPNFIKAYEECKIGFYKYNTNFLFWNLIKNFYSCSDAIPVCA